MTSGKFLRTQELECLLAVDTICGHLKYWGVFCISILATVQHCSISVYWPLVVLCISVWATGSILYQCIGHTQSARNLSCGSWGSNKGGQIASPSFAKKQFLPILPKNFPYKISRLDIPNNGREKKRNNIHREVEC